MRALPLLFVLTTACPAARPLPAPKGAPPCAVLPLLGAADPQALAADAEGAVALAGRFSGTLRAGTAVAASAGRSDAFVLRLNADGSVRWLHRIGGLADDGGDAVVFAPNGDVVAAGAVEGHCFAARLAAADGRELWTSRLEGSGESRCRALAFDAAGDVWSTGPFSGSLKAAQSHGLYDLFVVKFAGASGEATLVRTIGGKGKELPRAIVALPAGGVLVGGQFGGEVDVSEGAVDFGRGPVDTAGDYDGFVLRLAADGKTQWVATFGDNGDDEVNALALGPDGAIYASGHHQPAGNYEGLNPHEVGNFTGIVLRYSPEGRGEWVRIFEGASSAANHLAFDERGRLWTAGASHGLSAGSVAIEPAGGLDGFALALDPRTGEPLGGRRWGTSALDIIRGVVRIPGGLAFAGMTAGELVECGKPIGTAGETTAFIEMLRGDVVSAGAAEKK